MQHEDTTNTRPTKNVYTVIRRATPTDAAVLIEFIRELAEYERLSLRVCVSEAVLADWLEKQKIEALLADCNGQPAGFAVFYPIFSTFQGKEGIYLEDVFVRPAFRRQGVASAMFQELKNIVCVRGGDRIEWKVLDWNETGIGFYQKMGAAPVADWIAYRLKVT